jgi:DNA-binding transcriptional ArsR family regulator
LSATSTATARPRLRAAAPVPSSEKVTHDTVKRLCEVFKMLSDPSRLRILLALAQNGAMSVTDLCDLLRPQSQPAVSHHLSLMKYARLVICDRKGKNNFYRLDCSQAADMLEQVFGEIGGGSKQIHCEDFTLSFRRK